MNIRLRFLLAGFCIGLAELLPGISGATVALMFGIYKKLIECISKLKDLDLLIPIVARNGCKCFWFFKTDKFFIFKLHQLIRVFYWNSYDFLWCLFIL